MDLISKQKAIEAVNSLTYPSSLMDVKRKLIELPPAEPQIIRCKDCRHRDEFGCCKYWVGLTMGMPTTATDDDDFCSHAERKEVTE